MSSEFDLASLISAIYEAGMDFSLWPYALGRIAAAYGAPSAGMARQGRTPSECWGFSSASDPNIEKQYIDHYHSVNPIWQRASSEGVGTVQTDTMVMPRRELRRTEFFNDFLVPQQMESMLNTVVLVEEGRQTVVTVRRNREFGADHVKLYKLLAPHLQRAVQINIKLAKAELNHIWSVAALNHLEDGILFVDGNAKVRFANSAAEMFFLSRDIRMHKGRLSANSAAETEGLHAVIAKCSERGIPLQSDFVWLRREAGRSPLCLLIAPLPVAGASLLMSSLMSEQPMAVIFVKDPDKNNRPTLPQLREKFGMTLAEAGFAIEISKGDGIQAAADRLSISRATARTHLSRIFDKTGTRRQAELVRVLISTSTPGAMNL